jgi:hypothetical protein
MEEECPLPPELKKEVPHRVKFPIPKGFPEEAKEAFKGWLMERVFRPEKTPTGCWYSIIDYIKFDDGSHALRFWFENWERETGKFRVGRGMFLREDDIEDLKRKADKTFAIKALLRKFVE